jgi:SlyX protein
MSNDITQRQIDDLQSRVAFQEDALHIMSDQIAEQADDLRRTRDQIHLLNQKLNDLLAQIDNKPASPASERPPHY